MWHQGNSVQLMYPDSKTNSSAKHFILWSGGCDSTLLLYELLELYGASKVVAVSYNYPWLDSTKQQSENLHRTAIKSKLALKGHHFSGFSHANFNIEQKTCSGPDIRPEPTGLPQAIGWLLSIPFYVPDNSYVYGGYIKGDELAFSHHEYNEIFKNVSKVLMKDISLRVPYMYLSKPQIIEKLIGYGIYDETWYCEMPRSIGNRCNRCVPCKTHIAALNAIAMTTDNELVRLTAQKELDNINRAIHPTGEVCCNTENIENDKNLTIE